MGDEMQSEGPFARLAQARAERPASQSVSVAQTPETRPDSARNEQTSVQARPSIDASRPAVETNALTFCYPGIGAILLAKDISFCCQK